jgi:hypothetical protein
LITALREERITLFGQAAWPNQDSRLPAVYLELLARLRDPRSEGRCRRDVAAAPAGHLLLQRPWHALSAVMSSLNEYASSCGG